MADLVPFVAVRVDAKTLQVTEAYCFSMTNELHAVSVLQYKVDISGGKNKYLLFTANGAFLWASK